MKEPLAYSHLETDAEFRARLKNHYIPAYTHGDALDEYVWAYLKRQRKIVVVYP